MIFMWSLLIFCVVVYLLKLALNSPDNSVRHMIAVMVDDLVSVIFWHQPGITISSECAMAAIQGKTWGKAMCKFLGWLNQNHCPLALHADLDRATHVIERISPYL